MSADALLLVDLDGVIVYECGAPLSERLEIFRLHERASDLLGAVDAPVVILTHRSRAEARRILHAAQIPSSVLAGIVAAEDLFLAGLRGGLGKMARLGLRKSLILPTVETRFGVPRGRVAFLDDRMTNLEDLLECGLGLAMLAPSRIGGDRLSLHSFDLAEALATFAGWRAGQDTGRLVRLSETVSTVRPWQKTGFCTSKEGRHAFNLARRVGGVIRRALQGAG